MKHDEAELQAEVVAYLRGKGWIVFSIPNERNLGAADALRMRATGLTKGAPDLILYEPNGVCHWVELKTPKGKRSLEQECFERIANDLGIQYHLIRCVEDVWGIEK